MAKGLPDRGRRLVRFKDFDLLVPIATRWFDELGREDPRSQYFKAAYKFNVVPGGRAGGIDKRLLEVFFGYRPIEYVSEIRQDANGMPVPSRRFTTEAGAGLRYQRTDRGSVICVLEPAQAENDKRPEDLIVLGQFPEPRVLLSKVVLKSHWKYLISYLECSSIDGEPQYADRVRVWWLLFTRPEMANGKIGSRRITRVAGEISKWALTIGLSGALLEGVRWIAGAAQG